MQQRQDGAFDIDEARRVLADARVIRLGRTMSFGRVTLLAANDKRPVAMVSSAFAML